MGLEAKVIAWRPGGYTTALRLWALWGVLLLICCTIPSHPAATQEASYVVMGARGAVARIVFQGDAPCPQIALDGVQQAMDVRPRPSSGFVVTVCEKLIPPGTKSASILGTPLPVPKNSLTSIVVFGDTGCRRKFQPDCSANEWPFKGLSDNAAASHPDLVIHVGDYLYRGNDTWENWKADFFDPARNLLAAAPWIAARGNHEICSRGGRGYLLLLAPKEPTECKGDKVDIAPYTITIGERQFIVFDSSGLPHEIPDVERYTEQFKNAVKLVKPHSWFITHVPIWGVRSGPKPFLDPTLQQALKNGDPDHSLLMNVELFLGGHIHLWEAIGFEKGLPQFVLGNGGANLAPSLAPLLAAAAPSIRGRTIDGRTVNSWNSQRLWGSTQFTLTSPDGGWKATATFLDKPVNKSVVCDITSQGRVSCGSLQVSPTQ